MTLHRSARLLKRDHNTEPQADDGLAEATTLPALTLEQEWCRLNERIAGNEKSIQDQVTKIRGNRSRIRELELFLGQKTGGNLSPASSEETSLHDMVQQWAEQQKAKLDDWERLQRKMEKSILKQLSDLELSIPGDLGEQS